MTRECAVAGKRVIVATHLLESMIENPMPTRAEVTDVANAINEEVDAVMLSGETTIGKYPVKCVENLDKIARSVEPDGGFRFAKKLGRDNQKQNIASSAVHLANTMKARAIVVITRKGRMANYVANCRPREAIIFGFSNESRTRRQLALCRGVYGHRIHFSHEPEKTLATAFAVLLSKEGFSPGDSVVVISDVLAGTGTDAIQVRQLKSAELETLAGES